MMGVVKQMPQIAALGGYLKGKQRTDGIHKYRMMGSYDMTDRLKSPFPWVGGKSDQAAAIWARLGDCPNYVEPFAGSAAVTLARPHDLIGKTETLNDLDGHICNVFRAITFDPETTAAWCDFPVSEADLTARHLHLKAAREDLTARLFADPFYFDPILASFWCWGIASWIGDGWGVADGPWVVVDGKLTDRRTLPEGDDIEGVPKQMPKMDHESTPLQSYRGVPKQMPMVGSPGEGGARLQGIQRYRASVPRKMPEIGKSPNGQMNFNRKGVQAVRYQGVPKKIPNVGANPDDHAPNIRGVNKLEFANGALLAYFLRLSERLRRVRFLCGDWRRAVKDSITVNHGLTGIFLDPPYPTAEHSMEYHAEDEKDVWFESAQWAVERGDDPRLRICVAGYWSEATDAIFPASWERLRWEARGGYANQKKDGRGRENAKRECLWFNPSCLNPADEAKAAFARPITVRDSDYTGTMFE